MSARATRPLTDRQAFHSARHALAVNSATAGLHLALEALGVAPGSVVLLVRLEMFRQLPDPLTEDGDLDLGAEHFDDRLLREIERAPNLNVRHSSKCGVG